MFPLGVIIGRQGFVIKGLSDQSNCTMQLAELADPFDTKERIMIILSKNGNLTDLVRVSTFVTYFRTYTHLYCHFKLPLHTSDEFSLILF